MVCEINFPQCFDYSLYIYSMSGLHIIKASAGSGKTFSLTREFLKIVLAEPTDYYKHVLAVTFTNKATSEMKERILAELHKLGANKKSDHLQNLLEHFPNKREGQIREKSSAILQQILHGYSWFRIETIDSFFQGVIRSFIREIGVTGNYTIEIDQDKILEEAIERFLDNIGSDKQVLGWVLDYITSKIDEGKSWVIKNELHELGNHLFNEKIISKSEELKEFLGNEEVLKAFRDVLIAQIKIFEQEISSLAKQALSIIDHAGLASEDLFQGNRGPYSFFTKNAQRNITEAGTYVLNVLETPEKWPSGKTKRKQEVQNIGELKLNPLILEIKDIMTREGAAYHSCVQTLKNYHILGLIYILQKEIVRIKQEKGIMLISDAAPFIQKIINGNDIPFIYEKIGTQFNHLLIDEFQDTSDLQWQNFKPLLENSLSNKNKCLVVGDVKQSIYRWRNSNWEILAHQLKGHFAAGNIVEEYLDTNRRSCARIIRFNNLFFEEVIHIVEPLVDKDMDNFFPVSAIYDQVSQLIPDYKSPDDGYFSFRFYDEKTTRETEDYFGNELVERINECLGKNYNPGDIALLVRNKYEGALIAQYLVEANKENRFSKELGVISNESLFLVHSPVVKLLIAAMRFIYEPQMKIIAAELISSYLQIFATKNDSATIFPTGNFSLDTVDKIIGDNFTDKADKLRLNGLYNTVESLCSILDLYSQTTELVYLHSFFDVVFQYSTSEMADLSGFLKYWDEEGTKKTISAAETLGSVRIMTIHKSKGLQFPVVIIPFTDWKIAPKSNEILWVDSTYEPFNKLPLIPLNYSSKLSQSFFQTDYQRENYLTLIDNLNLLYVAFTRAEDILIGMARTSEKVLKTCGDILYAAVQKVMGHKDILVQHDIEANRYFSGIARNQEGQPVVHELTLDTIGTEKGLIPSVRISSQASEFMRKKDSENSAATLGRIYHAIMEKIKTKNDIDSAFQRIILQGIIGRNEAADIKSKLLNAMQKEKVADWFTEKYEVLTETDIIGTTGSVKRPDRIMINGAQAMIVDYKFGSIEDVDKHTKQVSAYMKLIKNMGYAETSGYIWYVFENDLVEVTT